MVSFSKNNYYELSNEFHGLMSYGLNTNIFTVLLVNQLLPSEAGKDSRKYSAHWI